MLTAVRTLLAAGVLLLAPSCAAATTLEQFHAGPVAPWRADPGDDPCAQFPASFARTVEGATASDWCAAFGVDEPADTAFDLELPEGTRLGLAGVRACQSVPDCPPESQIGTMVLRSPGPFGELQERGALVVTGPAELSAILAQGPAGAEERRVVAVTLAAGPLGGQVVRVPPLVMVRATDVGDVTLRPRLAVLRFWGARPGSAETGVQLGGCDTAHRARLIARPQQPGAAPSALVDTYLLSRCGERMRTALALPSATGAGRLPPVTPYFATQIGRSRRGVLGTLQAILLPELPTGTAVRATVERAAPKLRQRQATVDASASAVLRWNPPLALTDRTLIVLTASLPGTQTIRMSFRFVVRDGAVRARHLQPRP